MPANTHLVCEHLENISRDVLEKYQEIVRDYVSRRNGVYALYRRGKLHYVGLASDLRSRLTCHLNDRHSDSWDRFSVYLTTSDSHLRELEALLIRIATPEGNRQVGKFPVAEDLRRRLERDMHTFLKQELVGILGKHPEPETNGRGDKARPRAEARPLKGTKKSRVLEMLCRRKGATQAEIALATEWQPHTIRAFVATAGKAGAKINRSKNGAGDLVYRIIE